MARNTCRQVFTADGTFVTPGGVNRIIVKSEKTYPADKKMAVGQTQNRNIINADGTIWGWGTNAGVIGDGTATSRTSPVPATSSRKFVQLLGAVASTLAIDEQGQVFSTGANNQGQGAVGDVTTRSSFVAILGGLRVKKIATGGNEQFFALDDVGRIWAWGLNQSGQLGDGTIASKSSPVLVVGGVTYSEIMENRDAFGAFGGIDSSGQVFMWGANNNGQLGDGTVIIKSSPVAVVGGHVFTKLVCIQAFSVAALKADGSVWCWGQNTSGQLGDNTVVPKSSPVAVVGGHSFTDLFGGRNNFYGLKSDGSAWSWGPNASGQIGDGTVVPKSSPVAVLGGHIFTKIQHGVSTTITTMGLTTTGEIYAWGQNSNGLCGNGVAPNTTAAFSSPVLVAGGRTWSKLFLGQASSDNTAHAVDVDGTVWGWGENVNNTIGNGTVTSVSSPVAVIGAVSYNLQPDIIATEITVTPGTSYAVSLSAYMAKFGTTSLRPFADKITVEWQG